MRDQRRQGFTLIELSIVLVIIGLITGGVLVGHDMIKAAEVRKTVSMMGQVTSAVNAFRMKYGGLPGDITNASSFFTGAVNGDGDGMIDGLSPPEPVNMWNHLAQAGLVPGTFQPYADEASYDAVAINPSTSHYRSVPKLSPATPSGYNINLSYESHFRGGVEMGFGHYFYLAGFLYEGSGAGVVYSYLLSCVGTNGAIPCFIRASEAYDIDQKIDDGLPASGRAIQINDGVCNTGTHYDMIGSDPSCAMLIQAGF